MFFCVLTSAVDLAGISSISDSVLSFKKGDNRMGIIGSSRRLLTRMSDMAYMGRWDGGAARHGARFDHLIKAAESETKSPVA